MKLLTNNQVKKEHFGNLPEIVNVDHDFKYNIQLFYEKVQNIIEGENE
jgi:hypothetical protein